MSLIIPSETAGRAARLVFCEERVQRLLAFIPVNTPRHAAVTLERSRLARGDQDKR